MTLRVAQSITVARYSQPGHDALAGQLGGDPAVAGGRVRIVEYPRDDERELPSPFRRAAFRPGPPLIESRLRHSQPPAHARDRGSGAVAGGLCGVLGVDELLLVPDRCSLAEYSAAVFRKLFSISSSRL